MHGLVELIEYFPHKQEWLGQILNGGVHHGRVVTLWPMNMEPLNQEEDK
jgi:hypothetical protein